jgi:NADH-quinone oxidoreductase subunit L
MFVLIPVFPLIGVLLNGLLGAKYFSKRTVHGVAVGMAGLSFAASAAAFVRLLGDPEAVLVKKIFTWIPSSLVPLLGGKATAFSVDLAFRYDSLTAVMTLVVTGVGLLIHIYSIGYMAHEKSYARFFTYLNLFTFAMLILVLGANLAVIFIGWEGVGLCSYLLIGFWFTKDSAANAGKKAFITNRVGDFGFLIGMGLLISALGTVDTVRVTALVEGGALSQGLATAAALFLFLGATGKSAQIPLYTWLPDAMEGPTPVSALIHAATMVTAGVYLVARMHALFSFSGTALTVVALVGAFTAVYAASLGLVQNDIKRVLAYSTISQIGYMFVGLGVGAYSAGVFHLLTHAFFKSLLFLAAGSVIHALSGEQDMRKMGGLRARIPKTYRVFLAGALAIAGIPGLAGFFSKDEILAAAWASGNRLVYALGLLGAAMTAFYMFRLIFLAFHGKEHVEPEAARHLHESPPVMVRPLVVLAGLSVVGGYIGLPAVLGGGNWFGRFLEASTGTREFHLAAGTEYLLMTVSTAAAVSGIALAWWIYVKREGEPARRLAARLKTIYRILTRKYYVDELYNGVFVAGAMALGRAAGWIDAHLIDGVVNGAASLTRRISNVSMRFDGAVVDGAVNGVGTLHRRISQVLKSLQTGYVYNYAMALVFGIAVILALIVAVF